MRGGKREGAGRKGRGITKVYRLPVELEPQIMKLMERHKNNAFDSVTKSKVRIKPDIPRPTGEQLKRLQIWLTLHKFARSPTEARKMTNTNKKVQEAVLKCTKITGEKYSWTVQDLINLYDSSSITKN
jgi:hypothetical protein